MDDDQLASDSDGQKSPDLDDILTRILVADQINHAQGSELNMLKNIITNNLSYLPELIQKIPTFQGNKRHLLIIFILIRDTLRRKGCLLNLQRLQELVELYFPIIDDLSQEIALYDESPIYCAIAAYIYRFIFEILIDTYPTFEPVFTLISTQSDPRVIIGLKMMISIVDIMREPMKHISTVKKSLEIARIFEQSELSNYFRVAAEYVFNLNETITPIALDLMITIFKFFRDKTKLKLNNDKEQFDYDFDVPEEMFQFCFESNVTENLFNVFNQMKLNKSIDCIFFLCCASKISWNKIGQSPISFINSIESGLTEILNNSEIDDKTTFSITMLIFKLGKLIWISQDDDINELSQTFIPTVHQFSLIMFDSFSEVYMNSCFNIIQFWAVILKKRSFVLKNNRQLTEFYRLLFQEFITSLLNSSILEFVADFNQFVQDLSPLLEFCKFDIEFSCQFLSDITNSQFDAGIEIGFPRICLIVLIIASFFSNRMNDLLKEQKNSIQFFCLCIQLIFEIIEKTSEVHDETIFDSALIQFSSNFFKTFYTSPILDADNILENLEIEKQQAFDIIVNRLLNDLVAFVTFPDTIIEMLTFFNDLLTKWSEMGNFFNANEMFNLLASHQLLIDFNSIDIEKVYDISIELSRFYLFSVQYNQLSDFLSYFDDQFTSILFEDFRDPRKILILYRQIEGVLGGSKSSDKYTFVWRWILRRHSEHMQQCILKQSNEPVVIRSIMDVLVNLAIGSNLNLPGYSAEGLEMVKLIHLFLDNIIEKVEKDDDIIFMIVKLLALCISSQYLNYGIMKLYNDETVEQMVTLLFNILRETSFDAYTEIISIISKAFNSILEILPEMIANDDNFQIVLNFYLNLIQTLKFNKSEYSVENRDAYTHFTTFLNYLTRNQMFQVWPNFRPTFLALLNTLFDAKSIVVNKISEPFFLIAKYDIDFVSQIFQSICELYDEDLVEEINELFQSLLHSITSNNKPNKKFSGQLDEFANRIRKYSIDLDDLPDLLKTSESS